MSRLSLVAALAGLVLAGSGCGGEESRAPPAAGADSGPVHVHGLGLNPKDGALFIATHTGLFRVGKGETKARRVGDRRQDTMGFTVVGPDRFLGSGHPDLRDDLPPLLGLIESRDAGRTWRSVSLLGEADFHVLRAAGERVYGFDASHGRLMVSRDGGASWAERPPPGGVLDLVVHPEDPKHLLATGEGGLVESLDEGRTWRRVSDAVGLLAWPAATRLYLLGGGGAVFGSADGGRHWTELGAIGGEPAAFMATGERELYAALHDATVKRSTDGGASWSVRSRP